MRPITAGAGLLASSLLVLVVAGADAGPPTDVARARALATEPAPHATTIGVRSPQETRASVERRRPAIPLPNGGNFNGIRWEQGDVPEAVVEGVLEYNAACQWLRAREDGREADSAAAVLDEVPRWPALRGTAAGEVLRGALSGADDSLRSGVLQDCRSAHEREVQHAQRLGLPPST